MPVDQSGWLERVTIERSRLVQNGATIVLGKVTLIVGTNGIGKSALCEWISGCCRGEADLRRWSGSDAKNEVRLRLSLLAPDRVEFAMTFSGYNIQAVFDGRRTVDLSHLLRVFYVQEERPRKRFEDDLEYLARMWRIHPYQVSGIVDQICSSRYGHIRKAEFRPEEADQDDDSEEIPEELRNTCHGRPPLELWAEFSHHKYPICFRALSGSEVGQILISGAAVLADHASLHQGAVLLLDLGANFDDTLLSRYTEMLQGSEFRFQTLMVSPSPRPKVNWTGWSVARLAGERNNVRIDQTVITNAQSDNATDKDDAH